MKKKILILGASSYVGRELIKEFKKKYSIISTYYNHPIENGILFDATSMNLEETIPLDKVSYAIILLGNTKPDNVTDDVLNVDGIKRIIDCLVKWDIKPIFTSTDFVFDGEKGNYIETDIPHPILIYGKQKIEIEKYIQQKCKEYLIVRLSKVFGYEIDDGTLFTNWLSLIRQNKEIVCSTDQRFTPIYILDVITALDLLIEKNSNGIFHISSKKSYTRLEFLNKLLEHIRKHKEVNINVKQCLINDFKLKERRPINTSMIPNKLIKETEINIRDIDEIIEEILRKNFFYSGFTRKDENARTMAFFCTSDIVSIDKYILQQLINESKRNGNCDIRLSLHKSQSDDLHNMIVLLNKGIYRKPHLHKIKDEMYHMIKGSMNVKIFDNNGKVISSDKLSPEDSFMYRIPRNTWNTMIPLDDYVIFNESKCGPFIKETDAINSNWDYTGD